MATLLPDASARAHTFDGLADDIINYALKHARTVTARRGETITRQGDPALQILVVREGYAKLVSTSAGGHNVLVGIAGPRDAFGHAAVAGEARDYLVTSTALTAFSAAAWDRDKGSRGPVPAAARARDRPSRPGPSALSLRHQRDDAHRPT